MALVTAEDQVRFAEVAGGRPLMSVTVPTSFLCDSIFHLVEVSIRSILAHTEGHSDSTILRSTILRSTVRTEMRTHNRSTLHRGEM